jgi:hypothetical protein
LFEYKYNILVSEACSTRVKSIKLNVKVLENQIIVSNSINKLSVRWKKIGLYWRWRVEFKCMKLSEFVSLVLQFLKRSLLFVGLFFGYGSISNRYRFLIKVWCHCIGSFHCLISYRHSVFFHVLIICFFRLYESLHPMLL